MPKKPELDEPILKVLEKGALTGKELKKEAINKLPNIKRPEDKKKTFDESIMRLMDKDKVHIIGYEPKPKGTRRQNLKSDYLIFSLMKTDPLEILHIFNKMSSDNLENAKIAKNELKKLFSGRIQNIESKKLEKWNITEDILKIRDLNDDELAWIDAYWIIHFYNLNNPTESIKEYSESIGYEMEMSKKKLPQLREKYEYLNIRYLAGEEHSMPIKELYGAERFIRYNLMYNSEDEKQIRGWQIKEQGLEGQDEKLIDALFTYNKPLKDDEFIKMKLGYSKPGIRTSNEINELFEDIISYIKSQNQIRDALTERFVHGLSERKDADKSLENLISEVSGNKLV
ncbi:MAG: hypothetical protein HZC47_06465 [Methanobacterium sp.]|uniref:hypothetical protein n=1 Tax=Methanobacterium sp. TaxID=2164 RepID=UPI003D65EC3B|nr:hypothetical protein [Methanobacterium sp.]